MNQNFKKVMDLIAEMKQSFKRSSMIFEQAALTDGTIVEYESLEVGQPVFVVTEDETIPAPEGTHALTGEYEGVSIIVDANGIITEIVDERITTEEASAEAPVAENMSTEKVEQLIMAKLESFNTTFDAVAEMVKVIANENEKLSKEIGSLKGEFESFKSAPTTKENEGEKFAKVGNLTAKQLWLKNNKNK